MGDSAFEESSQALAQRLMLKYNLEHATEPASRGYRFVHIGCPTGRVGEFERIWAGLRLAKYTLGQGGETVAYDTGHDHVRAPVPELKSHVHFIDVGHPSPPGLHMGAKNEQLVPGDRLHWIGRAELVLGQLQQLIGTVYVVVVAGLWHAGVGPPVPGA